MEFTINLTDKFSSKLKHHTPNRKGQERKFQSDFSSDFLIALKILKQCPLFWFGVSTKFPFNSFIKNPREV